MKGLDKEIVFEKLLKYGLFPEKLNKIFSSEDFGEYVIEKGLIDHQNVFFLTLNLD